jgi:predicted Zn-dependent protease
MITRRTLPLALFLAGVLACSEATSPSRVPNYEWRLFVQNDTLSFHWPTDALPVKIWVEDSLGMPERVNEAIESWRSVFLYGEYDAVIVSDSSSADVLVRVTNAPPTAAATLGRLNTFFPGCEGATDIDTVATRFQLQLPVRMYLAPRYNPATTDLTECFRVTARHELGHSLGLFQHTSDSRDIMYGNPEAQGLSDRDINTAQLVAHWPANLIPTR